MGGASSEIGADTKRVLLECAYFTPRGVRRSARRHGMHTESSHRFERGVDRGDTPDVLAHAASLIIELAHGAAVPGAIHQFEDPPAERVRRTALGAPRRAARRSGAVRRGNVDSSAPRLQDADRAGRRSMAYGDDPDLSPRCRARGGSHRRGRPRSRARRHSHRASRRSARSRRAIPASSSRGARRRGGARVLRGHHLRFRLAARSRRRSVRRRRRWFCKNPLSDERSVMRTSLLPGLLEAV